MKSAMKLRDRLERQDLTLGILLTDHISVQIIELAIGGGLDYVIVDMEHLRHAEPQVADICAFGRIANFPVLVRPSASTINDARSAMDLGPCGLLLPTVESAEHLNRIREAVYMPPRGSRRPGGPGNRWVTEYNYDSFKSTVEDHVIIIPQVETTSGLENAEEIANHELTTALGIGPFDLSAQLGVCGEGPQNPLMQKAMQHLCAAAESVGKPMWTIGPGDFLVEEGHKFVCFGEAMGLLQLSLRNNVDRMRKNAK